MDGVNATRTISMAEMQAIADREKKSAKLSENQMIVQENMKNMKSAEPENRGASLVAELSGKGTILNMLV